jgi:hypothetical protein
MDPLIQSCVLTDIPDQYIATRATNRGSPAEVIEAD